MRGSAAAEAVKNGAPISELKKYRFCKANADGWSKRYLATREIPYTQVNNYEVCLKMIERGRVDILVHSEKIINKLAETHNLKDKLVTHPQVVPESPAFHVLVSKKAAAGETFLQEFDEAFKRYHDDEGYAQLKSRYGY